MIIDTTYLLPLAKIEIQTDLFSDILRGKLILDVSQLAINLISIFELQAKASKLGIPPIQVLKAIRFIVKYLKIIDFRDRSVVELSFELRKILPDYIDCVILATAITQDDILLTEDTRILKIRGRIEENYGIKIISYKDLIKRKLEK